MREQPFQLTVQALVHQRPQRKRNLTHCNKRMVMEFMELGCETADTYGTGMKDRRAWKDSAFPFFQQLW